jgi:hypothetical protein
VSTLEPVPEPHFEREPDDEPIEQIAPANVLDVLRAERQKVVAEATIDIVVPGWRELLVLRLGPITSQQQQRMTERARRGSVDEADGIVYAFREVLGRATPDGELAVLVDAEGDALGLDDRLAELIALGPVARARDVVWALFAKANNPPVAVTTAVNEYLEWSRESSSEGDEDFVGE